MTAKQKTKYYLLIAAAVLLCVLCLYLFSDRVNSARETLRTADSILQDAYSDMLGTLERVCAGEEELTTGDVLELNLSVNLLCGQLRFFLNTEQCYELGDMSSPYLTFMSFSGDLYQLLQDACASRSLPAGLKEKLQELYEALRSAPDLQAGAAELEGFQLTH